MRELTTVETIQGGETMTITFYNVVITIEAATPHLAYDDLCNALDELEAEWKTDTYTIDNRDEHRTTTELLPSQHKG